MLSRYKWQDEQPVPEPGDFVWVLSPTGRRYGVIEKLIESRDGQVRSVEVRTSNPGENSNRKTVQGLKNIVVLASKSRRS